MIANNELDELEALFEEDDFEVGNIKNDHDPKNISPGDSAPEDLSDMQAEYEKLQKQMALLQEKMKVKKIPSQKVGDTTCTSEELLPDKDAVVNRKNFCGTFASPVAEVCTKQLESTSSCNHADFDDICQTSNQFLPKKQLEHTVVNKNLERTNNLCPGPNYHPPQKKPRLTHNPQLSTSSKQAAKKVLPPEKFFKQSSLPLKPKIKPNIPNKENYEIEVFSRIRLKQRYISEFELKQRMDGKMHVKPSIIRSTMSLPEDKDWVSIAVVAKQLDPQTAKNGKAFSIWHLTDLDDCTKYVAFFLFGKVHEELWRNITVGTVIGLLNPSIMPPKKDSFNSGKSYDDSPALTVDVAERAMKIGVAADLGWCTATKFRNKKPSGKCLAFINKQYGDVCVYHMQTKYKKASAKRGELQGTTAAPIPPKYKNTLWNQVKGDQFFYGGQTFSTAPPLCNPNIQKKESKMKLTKVFSSVNNQSKEVQDNVKERSKILQAISGIESGQSLAGCSDTFADMLASGDMIAGSRQFLNHLQKKEKSETKEAKPEQSVSPAELLKQQKELIESRKKTSKDTTSTNVLKEKDFIERSKKNAPTSSLSTPRNNIASSKRTTENNKIEFTTAEDIKKSTERVMQMKRERFLQRKSKLCSSQQSQRTMTSTSNINAINGDSLPQLGCDVKGDKEVDLFSDWLSTKNTLRGSQKGNTPTLAELRRRKAVAKLKEGSGSIELKKSDPNAVVLGRIKAMKSNEKLQEKVTKKVEENRRDLLEANKENHGNEKAICNVLSKKKMSETDFNKILNASSSHSYELDLEEMERQEEYFNPLIRKEMMEKKMEEVAELASKTCALRNARQDLLNCLRDAQHDAVHSHQSKLCDVVTCQQCDYTYWAPHDRCTQLGHTLAWKKVKKRFFECSNCKQRTTTWEPYPTRACRDCGSDKKWKRTSMLKGKTVKLESEILHIRGIEHDKFLNSVR